ILRPQLSEGGFIDEWFNSVFGQPSTAGGRGHGKPGAHGTDRTPAFGYYMDVGLAFIILILVGVLGVALRRPLTEWLVGIGGSRKGAGEGAGILFYMVAFGLPLALTLFFMNRPLRFGLAIGAIVLIYAYSDVVGERGESVVY